MADRQRQERVAERVKEELADILREVKDPRVGFASVVGVEVSPDLRHAKAFISVYGSPAEQEATMAGLEHARGFIRGEVGRRVRLFHVPELVFVLDTSIAHGDRINRLLHEIQPSGGASGDAQAPAGHPSGSAGGAAPVPGPPARRPGGGSPSAGAGGSRGASGPSGERKA
jgi:ribosome-binding factor A